MEVNLGGKGMLYYVQVKKGEEVLDLFFDANDELDAAARAYYVYPSAQIVGVRVVDLNKGDRIGSVQFINFARSKRHLKRVK